MVWFEEKHSLMLLQKLLPLEIIGTLYPKSFLQAITKVTIPREYNYFYLT